MNSANGVLAAGAAWEGGITEALILMNALNGWFFSVCSLFSPQQVIQGLVGPGGKRVRTYPAHGVRLADELDGTGGGIC